MPKVQPWGSSGIVGLAAARVALHAGSNFYCGALGRLPRVSAFQSRAQSAREILPALLFAQPNRRRPPPNEHLPTDLRFLRTTGGAHGDRFRPSAGVDAATSRESAPFPAFVEGASARGPTALARTAAAIPDEDFRSVSAAMDLWRRYPVRSVRNFVTLGRRCPCTRIAFLHPQRFTTTAATAVWPTDQRTAPGVAN